MPDVIVIITNYELYTHIPYSLAQSEPGCCKISNKVRKYGNKVYNVKKSYILTSFKMNTPTAKQQRYQRLNELFDLARQRYLSAGGDPHKSASGNHHLTPEEQQELFTIARSFRSKK